MPPFTTILACVAVCYISLTFALVAMSLAGIRLAGYYGRNLASVLFVGLAASYGIFASAYFRIRGEAASGQWASGRAYKWLMWFFTGVMFTIEDPDGYLDNTRPAVFVGNHQTELDVLMLGTIFPRNCSVTAKKAIQYIPLLGWFMVLSGSIFIDRKNSTDARQAMAGAASEMKNKNQSVYIFPEGTRSYSKEPMLKSFKKGAFHLAIQGGVPIVPVVVANYSHVLYKQGRIFKAGKIPCKVLEPIPTKGLTADDVDDLVRKTRDIMLDEIIALTAQARGERMAVPAVAATEAVARATGAEVKVGI
ncbi:hypothetical protein MKZ38_004249 [Zalerion maritima]|uniref:1-acyl-sn-glycerol-3-phosphate acyltransferase n=1 Tax=Zalerion maritima TaxID=339359 RepID=A0AAD5RMX6_9PEZI|nr:hypothetical protein MKZ38_004249 [Zalerion maritima]